MMFDERAVSENNKELKPDVDDTSFYYNDV